jgi:hypothetical protein
MLNSTTLYIIGGLLIIEALFNPNLSHFINSILKLNSDRLANYILFFSGWIFCFIGIYLPEKTNYRSKL